MNKTTQNVILTCRGVTNQFIFFLRDMWPMMLMLLVRIRSWIIVFTSLNLDMLAVDRWFFWWYQREYGFHFQYVILIRIWMLNKCFCQSLSLLNFVFSLYSFSSSYSKKGRGTAEVELRFCLVTLFGWEIQFK